MLNNISSNKFYFENLMQILDNKKTKIKGRKTNYNNTDGSKLSTWNETLYQKEKKIEKQKQNNIIETIDKTIYSLIQIKNFYKSLEKTKKNKQQHFTNSISPNKAYLFTSSIKKKYLKNNDNTFPKQRILIYSDEETRKLKKKKFIIQNNNNIKI